MGSQYTGTDSFPTDFTIPADGDPRNASSVNVAIEALGDRTIYLRNRAAEVLPTLDALKAVATPTNDLKKLVRGFGWYTFWSGASPGLSPFVVQPDDATPGAWVSATAHETTRQVWIPGVTAISTGLATPDLNLTSVPMSFENKVSYSGDSMRINVHSTSPTSGHWFHWSLTEHVIQGATLASATVFHSPTPGADVPTVFPQLGLFRMGHSLTYLLGAPERFSLRSGGAFQSDLGTGYRDGTYVTRSFVYTANQNNVIDKLTYGYGAIYFDDYGAGTSGNVVHGIMLSFTNIPDARR